MLAANCSTCAGECVRAFLAAGINSASGRLDAESAGHCCGASDNFMRGYVSKFPAFNNSQSGVFVALHQVNPFWENNLRIRISEVFKALIIQRFNPPPALCVASALVFRAWQSRHLITLLLASLLPPCSSGI